MTTTPPPPASRSGHARTPPSPKHGAMHDRYNAWSPRRSRNTSRIVDKYEHGIETGHSRTSVRSRARTHTHLSSPPSSPTGPLSSPDNTKLRRTTPDAKPRGQSGEVFDTDSDNEIANDSAAMFPTPAKTPLKKRMPIKVTERIIEFRPDHLNDAMPTQREVKKAKVRKLSNLAPFDVYDDRAAPVQDDASAVHIFTDVDARVPEADPSEDNPFFGPKVQQRQRRRSKRLSRKTEEQLADDRRIHDAADRGEGMVFNFRGKKVFRAYASPEAAGESSPEDELAQRNLRHQAGASADRPLTRSNIRPRRLFHTAVHDVDEEALTDIEMHDAADATACDPHAAHEPVPEVSPVTPPSTTRTTRKKNVVISAGTPAIVHSHEDDGDSTAPPISPAATRGRHNFRAVTQREAGKMPSPFDSWPRTKSAGRKRASEGTPASPVKRTRAVAAAESLASADAGAQTPDV